MRLDANKGEAVDRSQVWLAAWVSVATANDCKKPAVATDWADVCLADFDKRFPTQTAETGKGLDR